MTNLTFEGRRQTLANKLYPSSQNKYACCIPGCGRLTMLAAGKGLAAFHCRQHVEHKARHGHFFYKTYRASSLKPYLSAANSYLRCNANDRFIDGAVNAIRATLEGAGPVEIATRLKGLSAQRRAKIALARLRVAGITPQRIIAIVLAVTAVIQVDAESPRAQEFRFVQISKAVSRLASGYHRVWEIEHHDGRKSRTELHAFPRSSGPVLRLIGRILTQLCEWVVEKHVAPVIALKVRRDRRRPLSPAIA